MGRPIRLHLGRTIGKAYSQQGQAVKEAVLDYAKLTCRSIPDKSLITPQLVRLTLAGHAIYIDTARCVRIRQPHR